MKRTLSVYQFKVTLLDTNPPVWRRIQVDNFITLSRFSAILLAVMGWNNSHLHDLRIGGKKYGMPAGEPDEYSKGLIDEKKKKLRDFAEEDLRKFEFAYDFGDGWRHEVELEKVRITATKAFNRNASMARGIARRMIAADHTVTRIS